MKEIKQNKQKNIYKNAHFIPKNREFLVMQK